MCVFFIQSDYGFEVEELPDRKPSFPKTIHDNGMLHLVLHCEYTIISE